MQNSTFAIKLKLVEYCEVFSFVVSVLWTFHAAQQTCQENWIDSEELVVWRTLVFESNSERAERNEANISVSSLMLFPFLVELLLFCSAFYTIKMKAFEVSEFAYFIFFQRLCHSLLCK